MSLRPKSSVVPPGGFHFVDRSGPVPQRIDGTSFLDVAQRTLEYRLKNGLPPGEPAREVEDYVCTSWPHFCIEENPVQRPPDRFGGLPLSNKVAEWIAQFYAKRPGSVSQSTAEARANTCAMCPHNHDYRSSGCGSCIDNIQRVSFVWLHGRETTQQERLGACSKLFQHNGVAVFANAEQLPTTAADLPANCWRKS